MRRRLQISTFVSGLLAIVSVLLFLFGGTVAHAATAEGSLRLENVSFTVDPGMVLSWALPGSYANGVADVRVELNGSEVTSKNQSTGSWTGVSSFGSYSTPNESTNWSAGSYVSGTVPGGWNILLGGSSYAISTDSNRLSTILTANRSLEFTVGADTGGTVTVAADYGMWHTTSAPGSSSAFTIASLELWKLDSEGNRVIKGFDTVSGDPIYDMISTGWEGSIWTPYDDPAWVSRKSKNGSFSISLDFAQGERGLFVASVQNNIEVVPIPGAAYLFGSGIVALVGLKRRKNGNRK